MKSPDGITNPLWSEQINIPRFRSVSTTQSIDVDVCVVGAGIAGLTTAYMAAREGLSVIVLDEGPIGGGQTGRTSAHLASAIDDRFVEIEKMHGIEGSKLAHQSHAAAIDTIERIAREENIECEFCPPQRISQRAGRSARKGIGRRKACGICRCGNAARWGFRRRPAIGASATRQGFNRCFIWLDLPRRLKAKEEKSTPDAACWMCRGWTTRTKKPARIKNRGSAKKSDRRSCGGCHEHSITDQRLVWDLHQAVVVSQLHDRRGNTQRHC